MSRDMDASVSEIKLTESPWPEKDLEHVGRCPLCGGVKRSILHLKLVDNVFGVAQGQWAMWRCISCSSAYLDPRPSANSIHRAYTNYYTHQEVKDRDEYDSLNLLRKLRRRLVNGYTNSRFGTHAFPASAIISSFVYFLPSFKKAIDRKYRNLPKPSTPGGRLLDVGCGDGSFLRLAETCGWNVVGLDPDPTAVANCSSQGITVLEGGIERFDGQTECFDVITLNHVIEHVYDPLEVLKRCHSLLKPGGQLWLETPNINSYGHERFGKNWRGLECPRHLVLFSYASLAWAILNAGFSVQQTCARPSACYVMYRASFAMEMGLSPYANTSVPISLKLRTRIASVFELLFASRREFTTLRAIKSDG